MGETPESAIEELQQVLGPDIEVRPVYMDQESYRGYHLYQPKAFPPWLTDENSTPVLAGKETFKRIFNKSCTVGTWVFSTDGVYTAGKAGIPTIGFGPGREQFAHTTNEQVEEDQVIKAAMFFAVFPVVFVGLEAKNKSK